MAAIKDVAKLANVAVGTVSRYLNNPDSLTPAYRERVKEAIEALNYQPSRLAQAMRTKRTNMIALVVPEMQNQFYIELYNAIRISCYEQAYIPIMYTMEAGPKMLSHLFTGNGAAQIDGIILAFMDDPIAAQLIDSNDHKTPFILMSCNASRSSSSISTIISDVYSGGYEAAKYILKQGHTKIAYIGHTDNSVNLDEKIAGTRKAFDEFGVPFLEQYFYKGPSLYSTGYNIANRLMRKDEPPTAIIAANDMIAVGVIKYLQEYHYRIPEDISVMGYDGIKLGAVCTPSITTVEQPIEAMAEAAVNVLLHKINHPNASDTQTVFKPKLTIRQSTDPNAPSTLNI